MSRRIFEVFFSAFLLSSAKIKVRPNVSGRCSGRLVGRSSSCTPRKKFVQKKRKKNLYNYSASALTRTYVREKPIKVLTLNGVFSSLTRVESLRAEGIVLFSLSSSRVVLLIQFGRVYELNVTSSASPFLRSAKKQNRILFVSAWIVRNSTGQFGGKKKKEAPLLLSAGIGFYGQVGRSAQEESSINDKQSFPIALSLPCSPRYRETKSHKLECTLFSYGQSPKLCFDKEGFY